MSLELAARKLPKMELVPPREAEVEGIFRSDGSPHNGRIIYTERMLDIAATKASKQIKLDANGNEMWRKHPTTGEPTHPIYEIQPVFKDRRYILVASEVGRHVKRVYNFEPSAAEREQMARKEKERAFLEEFMKAALDEGLTPGQVVSSIKGQMGEDTDIDLAESAVEELAREMAPAMEATIEAEGDTVSVTPEEGTERRRRKAKE